MAFHLQSQDPHSLLQAMHHVAQPRRAVIYKFLIQKRVVVERPMPLSPVWPGSRAVIGGNGVHAEPCPPEMETHREPANKHSYNFQSKKKYSSSANEHRENAREKNKVPKGDANEDGAEGGQNQLPPKAPKNVHLNSSRLCFLNAAK